MMCMQDKKAQAKAMGIEIENADEVRINRALCFQTVVVWIYTRHIYMATCKTCKHLPVPQQIVVYSCTAFPYIQ